VPENPRGTSAQLIGANVATADSQSGHVSSRRPATVRLWRGRFLWQISRNGLRIDTEVTFAFSTTWKVGRSTSAATPAPSVCRCRKRVSISSMITTNIPALSCATQVVKIGVGPDPAEAVSKRAPLQLGVEADPPERFVSASWHFGRGKVTPESRGISSFDTASVDRGRPRQAEAGQERPLAINSRPSAHEERAALRRSNGDLHQHVSHQLLSCWGREKRLMLTHF
jgi:hypothetical protein